MYKRANVKIRIILSHLAVALALTALAAFGCPFFRLTGLTCPGCGLTRAYIHALHGEFSVAFRYNPFFFTIPFYIFAFAHRSCGFMRKCRRPTDIFLIVYTALLVLFAVARNCGIINGFIPLQDKL